MHGALDRLLGDQALRSRLDQAAAQIRDRHGLRTAAQVIEQVAAG